MKIKIDCNILEMTNGFLDNLSFIIECDITILDINAKIPFDSDRLKVRIDKADISDKLKEKLLKDNMLNQSVFEVIYKTIDKLNVNHTEIKEV